ncbi:MAG TPA: DUF2934 domain-containing protein [Rhodocyclaceae bacterium]|nr:DUF2934 domain-containing protein [Rhodocyclaceae bacterium]HMV54330.1 DUF2934 domain-containing protein [Rhodocyclaceae bacterium]HNA03623.1 DUF2934 domain-containing protein [Rhodocyclaceae bacterium]HNB78789.1 DUF2934 domain-containing protein [Rhodocyclaceae bacterium]HNH13266.1 DUF2934 domain-containing protein [Rhodocyclaceae bacterium]
MKTSISKSRLGRNSVLAAMNDSASEQDGGDRQQRIATAAYYKAETRGFEPGLEMDDWLQAEAEVDAAMLPLRGRPTAARSQAAHDDN